MTNHFPEAFKRFPSEYKKFKSFHDLVEYFKLKGGNRAPMTDAQRRALAVEAYRMGVKDVNYKDKNGQWRNISDGNIVKDKHQLTRVPLWSKAEVQYKNGVYTNIQTGEKLKTRYSRGERKGKLMKRKDWVYVSDKGKKSYIYPELRKEKKKTKKVKKSA